MEVGPLARTLIGYASGRPEYKEIVDATLSKLQVPAAALFSTLGRTAARALETQLVAGFDENKEQKRHRAQRVAAVDALAIGIRHMGPATVARRAEPLAVGHRLGRDRGRGTVGRTRRDDPSLPIRRHCVQHCRIGAQQLAQLHPDRLPGLDRRVRKQFNAGQLTLQEIVDGTGTELCIGVQPQFQIVLVALPLAPQQGDAEHQRRQQGDQHQHPGQFLAQAPARARAFGRHGRTLPAVMHGVQTAKPRTRGASRETTTRHRVLTRRRP